MTKILNYVIENDSIRITTDDKDMPVFVYDKHMFVTKAALLEEIDQKIVETKKKKDKKAAGLANLEAELKP